MGAAWQNDAGLHKGADWRVCARADAQAGAWAGRKSLVGRQLEILRKVRIRVVGGGAFVRARTPRGAPFRGPIAG